MVSRTSITAEGSDMNHDEQDVRATLDAVYAAWAENDADAFVRGYAADATAQLPGTLLPNRDAVRATMSEVFAGALKGSSASYEVNRIRFVGDDAAAVTSRGAIRLVGDSGASLANRSLDTWVLERANGGWLVKAYHNCPEFPGAG